MCKVLNLAQYLYCILNIEIWAKISGNMYQQNKF